MNVKVHPTMGPSSRADIVPGHSRDAEVAPLRNPGGPGEDPYLDITRIQQATGYQPAHEVECGIADYIDWLRSGHPR